MLDNMVKSDYARGDKARENEEKRRDRQMRLKDALAWLMNDKRGRLLMHEFLALSGLYRTTFIETPQRAQYMGEAMAFEEGRKQLGYKALSLVSTVCPETYITMIKENAND